MMLIFRRRISPWWPLLLVSAAIIVTMCILRWRVLLPSLALALAAVLVCRRGRLPWRMLLGLIPLVALTTLLNAYFGSWRFGLKTGLVIVTVLLWFDLLSHLVRVGTLFALCGRRLPGLSLFLSMTVAFVPKLAQTYRIIQRDQAAFYGAAGSQHRASAKPDQPSLANPPGPLARPARHLSWHRPKAVLGGWHAAALWRRLSTLLDWSMEDGLATYRSLQARGYGGPRD
ncbi:MAG: hypothetical protein LBL67_04525 [Coriobacteriales bacterium]|jgi:hypothetical protein|nr:hypothetical protein [Coriobacteriales bacterium]